MVMDKYTILCTELRGSAQSLNGDIEKLQEKVNKLQKTINKATRGEHKTSDLSSAYTAQIALNQSVVRLGEICEAMNSAVLLFSEASAELSGRANLTAYYMQHTDTLSYEGLMGTYSAAIASAGSAAAGYELVKDTLNDNGYSVGSLGSVANAVQDAIQREADERAKQAEVAKWALTGAVIVGGVVASFVTGGVAAPIVIGAISGAVMAGGNTAIDQYAEHGWDTDNWDYAEIGKDAFVGGVTGAATAYVGGKLTTGFTNWASGTQVGSTLLNSSSAVVRVGTGAAIGSVSEVVSGVGSRGVGGFMSTIAETGDVGESFSAAVDYAFDGKEIAQDAVLGGVQGGKQQYKEWKLDNAGERTTDTEPIMEQPEPRPEIRKVPPNEYEGFAPGVSMVKREGRADIYAAGEHYDEFIEMENTYGKTINYKEPKSAYVRAKDIEGVNMGEADVRNGNFWKGNKGSGRSQDIIFDKASKVPEVRKQLNMGKTLDEIADDPALKGTVESYYRNEPIKVRKYKDFYVFADSGRHRTIAGQAMDVEIPVEIIGEIK